VWVSLLGGWGGRYESWFMHMTSSSVLREHHATALVLEKEFWRERPHVQYDSCPLSELRPMAFRIVVIKSATVENVCFDNWFWGFRCGGYEYGCRLGCSVVWTGVSLPTFQRSVLPPSSGRKVLLKRQWTSTRLHGAITQNSAIFICFYGSL
jgi:hypothetical protein